MMAQGYEIKITKEYLLLVEGKDEETFCKCLLLHLRIDNVQVVAVGGKDNFPINIKSLSKVPGFPLVKAIGIVRDAEADDPSQVLQSINSALGNANRPTIASIGSFHANNGLRIGTFVMPNNKDKGMLEDLLLKALQCPNVVDCIDAFVECAERNNGALKNKSKAKVQAYLAAMPEIVNSAGLGAKKGYWDFDSNEMDDIKKFLQELISE